MLVCDALEDFPTGRKGYLIYGNPGATRIVLRRFPGAHTMSSAEEVAAAVAGTVIIPPDLATVALDYVEMPKTGRTYVFLFEELEEDKSIDFGLLTVKEKFSALKLPQIDCTNPKTPKPKQSVVNFLMKNLRLSEEIARAITQRANWDLGKIFQVMYLWGRIARGATLTPTQITRLIDTLLPLDPTTALVQEVMAQRFHRITPTLLEQADAGMVLAQLSEQLDKLRIVSRVLSESDNPSFPRETGLTQGEIKYFVPLARRFKRAKIAQWERELVWAHSRKHNPGALAALVEVLGR